MSARPQNIQKIPRVLLNDKIQTNISLNKITKHMSNVNSSIINYNFDH